MKVLITLTDVEPAVRLNALLEAAGNQTTVVSPLDDLRGEIKKFKPDLIVLTGALGESSNIQIVRDQVCNGTAVTGLADVQGPDRRGRRSRIGPGDGAVSDVAGAAGWRCAHAQAWPDDAPGRGGQVW